MYGGNGRYWLEADIRADLPGGRVSSQ
jgi:hypothetical protein